MTFEPGPLLASGRDADIFECGPGRVLRRSRDGRSLAAEARVMEFARAAGYPVPAVEEVSADGTAIVMERIAGIPMIDVLAARPWTLRRQADTLARLHHDLHRIVAPPWLEASPGTPGDRLLHLDLHPINVLVTDRGPVVIDWSGAARGEPATDVALTWLLMSAGQVPAGRLMTLLMRYGRGLFTGRFIRHFDRDAIVRELPHVLAGKLEDPHMSPVEQAAMRALVEKVRRSAGS